MSTQRKWAIPLMALGGLSILTGLYLDYIVVDYLLNPFTWAGIVGIILWYTDKSMDWYTKGSSRPTPHEGPPTENQIDHLERLAKLYQDGLITGEEYTVLKARLIVDTDIDQRIGKLPDVTVRTPVSTSTGDGDDTAETGLPQPGNDWSTHDWKLRKALASFHATDAGTLSLLAKDRMSAVRQEVARNPATPEEVVNRLLNDPDPGVARSARKRVARS